MGEEERRRKAIIDAAFAVVRAGGCMTNTILLLGADGKLPTAAQERRYLRAAEAFALECAAIEKRVSEE